MKIKIILLILMVLQCKPRPIEGLVYKEDKIDSVLIENMYPSRQGKKINENQIIFPVFYFMVEEKPNYITKKIKQKVDEENEKFNIKTKKEDYLIDYMPKPFILWKESNNDTLYTLYNDSIITKFMLDTKEFYKYHKR